MLKHYQKLKLQYKDILLFYRIGDFYELLNEDAITAAKELDLILTHRDFGESERVPMCGIPHHSLEQYIGVLINKGYKVAVAEQA